MRTPNPSERLTVTLTAEQAEHVREQLLADFAGGLDGFRDPRLGALKDTAEHVETYRARLERLDGPGPYQYTDRRCEFGQLARDLIALGADRVMGEQPAPTEDTGGREEAIAREHLEVLAPAFTARAILDQLDEEQR